ncbi:type II toxin-antitoxin system HicB family antitoxin [Candidatus Daviesbacteria bacterium]|nr:type II toxin-antitoxin system HicB family antitoxin [Candidatus Daviesbacteria bacterium]
MKNSAKALQFKVLIEQDEDGIFVASAPAIPGCHTQGETYEEAVKGIEEAIELCLEVAKKDDKYREKIDFGEVSENKPRFLGVVNIPIRLGFSV